MHALLMEPAIHYDPAIFAPSIIIAIAASTAALLSARTAKRRSAPCDAQAHAKFFANSVAQLNEQVDRMRGLRR
ncbi:MHYT domain-containing protein [Paraburkholderia fynbosensis]|uniref:MHYT domain-containing protein n=1 Tax=Paraburkholderia fynbosensis TaxID=1200993 RepID=A0A6J5FQQ3_9BURK|nr:hypothetical protein LMG27177_01817 [Paraburkholderia fynbosensis]